MTIRLSTLAHTWLIDIDGTVLEHNGHKRGGDRLLPGVKAFWQSIPAADTVVLLSARTEEEREATLAFIRDQGLRFDHALFGLPVGERVLINDAKPGGLQTAIAVNPRRDQGFAGTSILIDETL